MKRRRALAATAWAAIALAVYAFIAHGIAAGLSATLGVGGTAAYLWTTWMAVRAMGTTAAGAALQPRQMAVLLVALGLKFPVILGAMALARTLGPDGPTFFMLGLALVYSGLIGWAVASSHD